MNTKPYKSARWLGAIVALGAVVLLVALVSGRWTGQQPPPSPASMPLVSDASPAQPSSALPAETGPAPLAVAAVGPGVESVEASRAEDGAPPAGWVRVKAGQVLAVVNGIEITLKDLMPLPAHKAAAEQTLSVERFGFLLDRAIEREVAVQAAQRQGIELSVQQQQQLERLRARTDQIDPGVFDTLQQSPENTAFAVRDATGLLLEATLAQQAGVPSPHVTAAQVQAYYEQHQSEYGGLPLDRAQRAARWTDIDRDIRLKLAEQVRTVHEQELRQFRHRLMASARITKAVP